MIETGNNLDNNKLQFEPHEWAIVVLLRSVRDKIINPKLEGWFLKLSTCDDRNNEILLKNLAASFLNLSQIIQDQHLISHRECLQEIYTNGITSKNKQVLINLLDTRREDKCSGYLLFNSYFYTTVNAFGETSLIPVIPGYRLDMEQSIAQERFENAVLPYFKSNFLPFHVNSKDIITYASLILPCTGGITPLHFANSLYKKDKRNYTFRVPYFVGDLSILQKHEDYSQGHLSALGGIIKSEDQTIYEKVGEKKNCIGAYVLTSIMPDAFDDEDDEVLLGSILDEIRKLGILSLNPQKHSSSTNGIRIIVHDASQTMIEKIEIEEDLRKNLTKIISDSEDNVQAFKANFNTKNISAKEDVEKLSAITINMDSVYKVINAIFPSGPWLDRGLVCKQNGNYPINIGRLKKLCDNLLQLGEEKTLGKLITTFPLVKEVFAHFLLPELAEQKNEETFIDGLKKSLVLNVFSPKETPDCLNKQEEYHLLIVNNSGGKLVTIDSSNLINKLSEAKIHNNYKTPDGNNRLFAELQEFWINEQKIKNDKRFNSNIKLSSQTFNNEDCRDLFNAIRTLIDKNKDIRAVMLLKKCSIFTPSTEEDDIEMLEKNFLTYPAFWLFEHLTHIFTEDFFAPETLINQGAVVEASQNDSVWGYLKDLDDSYPAVKVTLGKDHLLNQKVIRSLVFLGMRVSKWLYKTANGDNNVTIELNGQVYGGNDIIKAYQDYLKILLKNSSRLESFRRIYEVSDNMPVSIEIIDEPITAKPNEKKALCYKIEFKSRHTDKSFTMKWESVYALTLQFCCIEDERILNALNAKKDELWQPQVQIDCRNSDICGSTENKCGVNVSSDTPCPAPSVQCVFEPINIHAGLNVFSKDKNLLSSSNENACELSANAQKYLCKIAEKIERLETIAQQRKVRGEIEAEKRLREAWSHAVGTRLTYFAGLVKRCNYQISELLPDVKFDQRDSKGLKYKQMDALIKNKDSKEMHGLSADQRNLVTLIREVLENCTSLEYDTYDLLKRFRDNIICLVCSVYPRSISLLLERVSHELNDARDEMLATFRIDSEETNFMPDGNTYSLFAAVKKGIRVATGAYLSDVIAGREYYRDCFKDSLGIPKDIDKSKSLLFNNYFSVEDVIMQINDKNIRNSLMAEWQRIKREGRMTMTNKEKISNLNQYCAKIMRSEEDTSIKLQESIDEIYNDWQRIIERLGPDEEICFEDLETFFTKERDIAYIGRARLIDKMVLPLKNLEMEIKTNRQYASAIASVMFQELWLNLLKYLRPNKEGRVINLNWAIGKSGCVSSFNWISSAGKAEPKTGIISGDNEWSFDGNSFKGHHGVSLISMGLNRLCCAKSGSVQDVKISTKKIDDNTYWFNTTLSVQEVE